MAYVGSIADILQTWADFGVFAYVLPFLIVFAVIFGILNKTRILGENKGVQAAISLAAGLLSLQFDYVPNFFASIFPYAGIGISILLVALILMGLIAGEKDTNWPKYVWFGIGVVVFIAVVLSALTDVDWFGGRGYFWRESWPSVLAGLILLGLMSLIIWGGGKKDKPKKKEEKD